MANMMETLRQMPKPNRADHGGKGVFRFCLDSDYALDDPASSLRSSWRTGADGAVVKCLPLLDTPAPASHRTPPLHPQAPGEQT